MGKPYACPKVLSTPLLFQRHFFLSNVNIHHCFPFWRKDRLLDVGRPWANGLARLLGERRLKKGELAELADVRPGTVSAVANSPKAPDVATLQRLADGFTKFDRRGHPTAPAVELWEFFVSDEQAALLRQSAHKQQQLVQQEELLDRAMARLQPLVASLLKQDLSGMPAATATADAESPPPGVSLPRGKLQDRKRA